VDREADPPAPSARDGLVAAVAFLAATGIGALALYLIHPVASGFQLPVGPDGPVYTWLARYASVAGFGDVPGGGPGVPALTLGLGAALRTNPMQSVYLLGPVLAVATGLAGGAAIESALGPRSWRTTAAVALVAAFAAYLAGGWLANLALVATFLAAIAALAVASASWRPVLLAAGLVAASGLAHRVFLAAALAVLALAVVLGLGEARRAVRGGTRIADVSEFREAIAATAGGVTAAAALVSIAASPALSVDTSQDGFFRRLGLRSMLVDRYAERFRGDLTRAAVPVVGGALLGGLWFATDDAATPGERFLRRAALAWAAITVAGVVALAVTGEGPPSRVLQFAFFLPLVAAAGVGALASRGMRGTWVGALAVAVFAAVALFGWARQSPAFESGELSSLARARPAIEAVPRGTPLVFLVDTDEPAAAYHVTRASNVIRVGVPPARIPDVRIAVGTPEDHLAGRPTLSGDPEHDAIARAYAREVAPITAGALTFVLRDLNPGGYPDALATGTQVGAGVVLLAGPPAAAAAAGSNQAIDGLSPIGLILLSPAALALLALIGAGWSSWGLAWATRRAAMLAAPSVGIAVTVLATVAAERLGMLPGSGGSLVVVAVLAGAGYLAAARA
jgi:hypothetical protein